MPLSSRRATTDAASVHFIGIGGIGVSAVARYLLATGATVSGSDLQDGATVRELRSLGASIHTGEHRAWNIPVDTTLVVRSTSIRETNPELKEAWRRQREGFDLDVLTTAEAIRRLFRNHFVVAIAGTHGKSTTTSMIAVALVRAGWNPTVIVGTRLREFGNSNFRPGGSADASLYDVGQRITGGRPVLVLEACEYAGAFLHYRPDVAVVTNVEPDHLDHYGNFDAVRDAFRAFLSNVPEQGSVVANADDFGVGSLPPREGATLFSRREHEADLVRSHLALPGNHNVMNGLAALKVARLLAVPDDISLSALADFKGAWRRFQIYEISSPVPFTLVDDVAHHPTALRATVQAARDRWPYRRLVLIYQPHQSSRTADLRDAFVSAMEWAPASTIILAETYDPPGRDIQPAGLKVSSQMLFEEIQRRDRYRAEKFLFLGRPEKIRSHLAGSLSGGEVVVVMGAGDIYQLSRALSNHSDPFTPDS